MGLGMENSDSSKLKSFLATVRKPFEVENSFGTFNTVSEGVECIIEYIEKDPNLSIHGKGYQQYLVTAVGFGDLVMNEFQVGIHFSKITGGEGPFSKLNLFGTDK